MFRGIESAFIAPSMMNATTKNMVSDSKFVSPVSHAHRLTVQRENAISSLISILSFTGRPIAIFRGITQRIIATLYCQITFRTATHIFKEILERMPPSLANRNSTFSVIMKRAIVRVSRSLNDADPDIVFRDCACAILRHTMSGNRFAPQASARLRVAASGLVRLYVNTIPAVAKTVPPTKVETAFSHLKKLVLNCQSSEFLTNMFLGQWLGWFREFGFAHASIITDKRGVG
jgi:hypothetical protein